MGDISQSLLKDLKQQIDELRVQLNLGSADARDLIDEHRAEFETILDLLKGKIAKSEAVSEEKTTALRGKLDALRLQIHLGEMEGREAYAAKRKDIDKAIGAVREDLAPLAKSTGDLLGALGVDFDRQAERFRAKLDTLGLNLGLGKIAAQEEAKLKKEEISQQLDRLSKKIEPAVTDIEKSLGHLAGEAVENFEAILSRIRRSL